MSNFLPARHGFKMACLNINRLVKHDEELRVLLAEFSIDILAINETKLDESIKKFRTRLAREIPLTSDEESIYLNNTPENYNKFCFRPTTSSVIFPHLNRRSIISMLS